MSSAYEELYQEGWNDTYSEQPAPYEPGSAFYTAYVEGRMAHFYQDHPRQAQKELPIPEELELDYATSI